VADVGFLESLAAPTPPDVRRSLIQIVREGFGKVEFGAPDVVAVKAKNFNARLVPVTTSSVADQEVAVAHGLARKPRLLIPALDPNTVNATIPALTITRAADATFFYLSSPTTTASFHVFVE